MNAVLGLEGEFAAAGGLAIDADLGEVMAGELAADFALKILALPYRVSAALSVSL